MNLVVVEARVLAQVRLCAEGERVQSAVEARVGPVLDAQGFLRRRHATGLMQEVAAGADGRADIARHGADGPARRVLPRSQLVDDLLARWPAAAPV